MACNTYTYFLDPKIETSLETTVEIPLTQESLSKWWSDLTTINMATLDKGARSSISSTGISVSPKKIYINRSKDGQTVYTTVEWADHEKTTVACSVDKYIDEYTGFTAALAKRVYGSTGGAIKAMHQAQENAARPARIKEAIRKANRKLKEERAEQQRKALEARRKILENEAFEKLRAQKVAQERYDNMIAQQAKKDGDK